MDKMTTNVHHCHDASFGYHREVVAILLAHDAHPDIQDVLGDTPLHDVMHTNHESRLAIADLLLQHGANIAAKNKHGETPMDLATRSRSSQIDQKI